jgi:hypothetical protein
MSIAMVGLFSTYPINGLFAAVMIPKMGGINPVKATMSIAMVGLFH